MERSKNPANSVAALVAVLGSEIVRPLRMQKFSTRGTRASSHAKGESPKLSFWLSNKAMHLMVTPAISQTPKLTSWFPICLHPIRRHLMYTPIRQSKRRASQSTGQSALQSTAKSPSPRPKLPRMLLSIDRQAARQSLRKNVPMYGASSFTQTCYLLSPFVDFT